MNNKERRTTLLLLGFFVSAILSTLVMTRLDKASPEIMRGLAQGTVLGGIYMLWQVLFNKWLRKDA